jgi:hypothetical protein
MKEKLKKEQWTAWYKSQRVGSHAPLDTDAQCTGLKVTSALRHLAGGKKGRYPPSICGAQKWRNDIP